jgi:ankyrin repeat protein
VSVLRNKSDENFKAINILIDSKLNTPVIHCAYYSSLQLIIDFLHEYSNFSEEASLQEGYQEQTHNFYLNKAVLELKNISKTNAGRFHKYFSAFKRKRKDADYTNIEILEKDALRAKESANKIRTFFNFVTKDGKCENIYII